MDRRLFLLSLAAGTLAAATACDASRLRAANPTGPPTATATGTPTTAFPAPTDPLTSAAASTVAPPVSSPSGPPLPPDIPDADPPSAYSVALGRPPSVISSLPGTDNSVALTIDDGVDSAVVGAYLDFIQAANVRLTFFVNGMRPSWTDHAAQMRPLVESGQVQLASHTWSHPDITKLADRDLAAELSRNEQFLTNTYGVSAHPFFRPPYGYHNNRTDRICADAGLTSIVMWYGSFGDSSLLTQDQLLTLACRWLHARRVVIGHANFPTVTTLYPQLLELLEQRKLTTVTLDDIFYGPAGRK